MRMIALAAMIGSTVLTACGGTGSDQASTAPPGASNDINALTATPAASAATVSVAPASFQCGAATEAAEKLICGDARLASLDREMFRLYQAAVKDPRSTPSDDALSNEQDEWTAGRDQCGADADPTSCVAQDYAERIHRLRQGSKFARDAPGGASEGPVAFRCKGMDALIGATFVNTGPNMVFLEWADQSAALTQTPSGSGAKYSGKGDNGDYSLWTKGEEALFQQPGGKELSCAEEIIG